MDFNLHELLFGFHKIKDGNILYKEKSFNELYNSMDPSINDLVMSDKDKGINKELLPFSDYTNESDSIAGTENKELVQYNTEALNKDQLSKTDPSYVPNLPKRTNPGPGFNVPENEALLQDEIMKYLDYSSHVLNHFKKMDLEVAIEQKINTLRMVETLNFRINFAQDALINKVPTMPNEQKQIILRNKILSDLEGMNLIKSKGEARILLLTSRIEFIENKKK